MHVFVCYMQLALYTHCQKVRGDLYGGASLDLVLATQALVLVSVHSPHLDYTLQGRGGGREGERERDGGRREVEGREGKRR